MRVATHVLQDAVQVLRQVGRHDSQVSSNLCCVAFLVRSRLTAPPIPISNLQSAKNQQLLERNHHTNLSTPVGRVFNRVHKPDRARKIHCRCYVVPCVEAAVRNTVACDDEGPCLHFMEAEANAVGEEKRRRPQDGLFREKLPHISSCCRQHDGVHAFTHDAYHLEDFRSRNENPELPRSGLQVGD